MIAALITIYNPDRRVADNIRTISEQVDRVYLCDNSSKSNQEMFSGMPGCLYIFNRENIALSGAFNRVLKNPGENWKDNDFIIFFDQDSSVRDRHVDKLIEEYKLVSSLGYDIGSISPVYRDLNTGAIELPHLKKQLTENDYIVSSNITSSLLCKYGTLKEIDFWNEEIFLDLADWDLCWRMMQKGKLCIRTTAVVLEHALGFGEKKIGPVRLGVTSTVREYYQTRNYLYLLEKKYTPLKYRLIFIRNLTVRPVLHLLFLDQKRERIKYFLRGLTDAARGIRGEYRE